MTRNITENEKLLYPSFDDEAYIKTQAQFAASNFQNSAFPDCSDCGTPDCHDCGTPDCHDCGTPDCHDCGTPDCHDCN